MNLCTGCRKDFATEHSFDAHRVGNFPQKGPSEYVNRMSAGLVDPLLDWKPSFGRRCLDDEELAKAGWRTDRHGRWASPDKQAAEPILERVAL